MHLTKDGQLVVVHDDDTGRVAGHALAVRDATVEELQRLDVGRWKSERFAGEKIPHSSRSPFWAITHRGAIMQ